tara:strand:+ start:5761 stop:6222 length:462 start_codon:yes stop_codon:yes gene_type:complete
MEGIAPFQLFDESNSIKEKANCNSTKNIIVDTPLSKIFFSADNIDLLQDELKQGVYQKTDNKYVIDRQSDTEILIIMRSIYLQNSKNLPYDIKKQVIKLNQLVLNYCIPNVISGILSYNKYIKDIENPIMPLENPQNVNSAGTKTLKSVSSIF